jgi:hypothetical protein
MLAGVLAVSPAALLAIPSTGADARTPAPTITAHPLPVYASGWAPTPLPILPVPITTGWPPPSV